MNEKPRKRGEMVPLFVHNSIKERVYSDMHLRYRLRRIARQRGMAQLARDIGVSRNFLYLYMNERTGAGVKILDFFDLDRHVVYTKRSGGRMRGGPGTMRDVEDGIEVAREEGSSGEAS